MQTDLPSEVTTEMGRHESEDQNSKEVMAEPHGGSSNALQIYCRLRPIEAGGQSDQPSEPDSSIERKSDKVVSLRRPNSFLEQQYIFEHVFACTSEQQEVFARCPLLMIKSLLGPHGGQDALLFAYGATSSGKSFTIGGLPHQPGIIPRSIDYLFDVLGAYLNSDYLIVPDLDNFYTVNCRISDQMKDSNSVEQFDRRIQLSGLDQKRYQQSVQNWSGRLREQSVNSDPTTSAHISTRRYSIFISFVEIYNNYIYDLLEQPDSNAVNWRRAPHALRHDARHTVYVCGANELEAKDADQAMRLFLLGVLNRQSAATLLNQCSSRSHSVFTIKVVSYENNGTARNGRLDMSHLQVNQLSIVDLAGVERTNRTKATGMKLTEASNINNSLLTLRSCFEAMRYNQQQVACSKQPKPIPYRQNKLTFLLKSFFEQGRAQIRMIVCVRPSLADLDDNVQVLGFGKKAQELLIEQRPLSVSADLQQDNAMRKLSEHSSTSGSSELIDLFEFTFTRFKCNLANQYRAELHREVGQYLQIHETNFDKMTRSVRKIMELLNVSLKPFPERQAVRTSIVLAPYHLGLSLTFSRKVLPIYRTTAKERESSCLFGVTSIAGTPLLVARPYSTIQLHKYSTKCIVVQELFRDLSIWESDSIDIGARLSGQLDTFVQYVAKLFNVQGGIRSEGQMDVFTRLYKQTPARYKTESKRPLASTTNTRATKVMSSQKVAMLKRLFTPDECSVAGKNGPSSVQGSAHPRHLIISNKIKTLTTQLNSLDPEFATKMNRSVKWSNSEQAYRAMGKTNPAKQVHQVKRQLFK